MENLRYIDGMLLIGLNDQLKTLSGIDNIEHLGSQTQIVGNPSLTICDIESICKYIDSGSIYIENNATGCNNVPEVELACGVGIDESSVVSRQSSVIVFPNPAAHQLYISLLLTFEIGHSEFEIINANGALMKSGRLAGNPATIDISQLPEGLYLLRIEDGKAQNATRFVKR